MSRHDHNKLHKECVNAIRLEPLIGRAEDFTLYENSKVQIVNGEARAAPGLTKGASDLIGILAPHGRIVAWEVKTGDAVPTAEQKMFMDLVRKRGGFACVIHGNGIDGAVNAALAALTRARNGERE